MALAQCWHCSEGIAQNHNNDWVDTRGDTYCPGNPDENHSPMTKDVILEDLHKRNPGNTFKSGKDSSTYCAGCHESFPSSQGFPHTQSGETLVYCPKCSDDGETLGSENGFSVSARIHKSAPSLDLVCDKCGEEDDASDDSETDLFGGLGETCLNCGKGKMKLAASGMTPEDTYEGADLLQADDQSAMTPDIQEGMNSIINAPRTYKAPRSMTREQVSGLDKNGDGIYPRSHKISSYNDLRKHLITHHGFKNDWLVGYNEKDLLRVYDQAHKSSAYACDHEHPVENYKHNTMITSNINKESSADFYQGENQMDDYTTEDFSAGDVGVDFAPPGVPLTNDYMNTVDNDAQQNRQTVDDSRAAWAAEIDRDNYNGKDENPMNNPAQQVYPYQRTAAQAAGFRKRQARKNLQMLVVASTQSPTIAGAKVFFANSNGKKVQGSVLVVGEKEFAVVWEDRKASMEKKSDYQLIFKNPQA